MHKNQDRDKLHTRGFLWPVHVMDAVDSVQTLQTQEAVFWCSL